MVADAEARALSKGAAEHTQAAAVAVIAALADRAGHGVSREALDRIGASEDVGLELRGDAALLARELAADEGTDAGAAADRALGVVDTVSVFGPFRDTGGGLDARDGPEAPGAGFDPLQDSSWGAYRVAWRRVPRAFAGARGVPLDVFVFPRKESCTWVATGLVVSRAQSLIVRAAASGQVRLLIDGIDVARDDSVNAEARFDRVAARVTLDAGDHFLAAKVCSGALDDDGRVRLRVINDKGRWPDGVQASAGPWQKDRPLPKAPAVRARSTPLSRAVGSTSGDVAARLDAATLRTLGGADDLRSPRAPGLLASLADSGIDADRLAMAAWIAPSASNRGAWFNKARDGADARTRAFVDRRLVERHLEAQLSDWAIATLRGARIDADTDGEACLLAAQVDVALGTDVLRVAAMRRLKGFMSASPESAPDSVVEYLSQLSESLDPQLAVSTRGLLEARGDGGASLVRVLAGAKGRDQAVRAAVRAFAQGQVDDADEALAVAQTISRAGAHAAALALYRELAAWAPNRAAVWSGLSHEMSFAGADEDNAALRRARELDPGETRFRAELALRRRTPTSAGEPSDDEKYIVSSKVILARRERPADAVAGPSAASRSAVPDVADRQLHWTRAVVMHPDRRVSEMVQYAREIVIPPRTEDELYEDVPAEGDLTEILRARVHRRDGTTAYPVEEASEARPRIRWPELSAGDVVEVAFRSWTAGPVGGRGDPPFYRLDYAGALSTHPVLYNEVVVESPADRPIYVDVVNGRPDRREDKDDAGKHVVRLVWDRPINVPDEPLAPPLSEVIPTVVLSTFRDWSEFRAWYGEAVRGFTEPDAQVRELAAGLTKGKATRDQKLRALFEFVADDIRYVNYVSGEWWLPNRPQQLLARREGDCDDKALLLITLLKAVGIDAQEVMVQTRLTGEPSILRAAHVAVPLFDHGIAFLPGRDGGTYLDATSPQSRLGPLPSMDARAVALRMDGPAEIVELPASSPDDHGTDATWTLAVKSDGSADLAGEERAVGDDAFWMRTYLTESGARAQWLEDRLVGAWFSTVQVDKNVDFRGDLARGAATARWRAKSDSLARREGMELVVPLSPTQTMASQLAPLVERTLPLWLPAPVAPRREARTIRVVAPSGWSFGALPVGGDEDGGGFGRAHFDVARDPGDPRVVVARRVVVFDKSAISVDEYPKWRAWVQRVDALMHKTVRILPPGGAR
jgi:transglutaminase-like putative cysteine protease